MLKTKSSDIVSLHVALQTLNYAKDDGYLYRRRVIFIEELLFEATTSLIRCRHCELIHAWHQRDIEFMRGFSFREEYASMSHRFESHRVHTEGTRGKEYVHRQPSPLALPSFSLCLCGTLTSIMRVHRSFRNVAFCIRLQREHFRDENMF